MALMVYYLTFLKTSTRLFKTLEYRPKLSKHHKENNAGFALIFKNQR
jgi:hypothetical protein